MGHTGNIIYNIKEKLKMEDNLRAAVENIRPYLQRDGGDIEFIEYTPEKMVRVKLQGRCAGCPGAKMTLKNVVEKVLREEYPDIAGVESVE